MFLPSGKDGKMERKLSRRASDIWKGSFTLVLDEFRVAMAQRSIFLCQ